MMIYNKIFPKILSFVDKVNGTTVREKTDFLMNSQQWTQKRILNYQKDKMKKVIKYCYNNIPYYNKTWKDLKISIDNIKTTRDLYKLPTINKQIVKDNFKDIYEPKKQGFFKFTSGSTGEPTKFYVTKENLSWEYASLIRSWTSGGYKLGDKYVRLTLNKPTIKDKIKNYFINCVYLYSAEVNSKTFKKYYEIINKGKIKMIIAYPSILYLFSEFIENSKLPALKLNMISTSGEILFPKMRKKIEKQFGCKILDQYGLGGEQQNLAFQCNLAKLYHLNPEHNIVEIDKQNNVLITTLNNFKMPLVRYKTGDKAIKTNKKCKCGRNLPVIERIIGRETDMIYTKNNFLIVHFFTILFEYIGGVEQFQIKQNKIDEVQVLLKVNPKFTKKDEANIIFKIKEASNNELKIRIKYIDNIPLAKSGKRRFIISEIKK